MFQRQKQQNESKNKTENHHRLSSFYKMEWHGFIQFMWRKGQIKQNKTMIKTKFNHKRNKQQIIKKHFWILVHCISQINR